MNEKEGGGQNARATVARAFCPEPFPQIFMRLSMAAVKNGLETTLFPIR